MSQFPKSASYDLDWLKSGSFGANPLWLTEWLSEVVDFAPGQRVLDIGCGRAKSSIFLAREFDVNVWAVDYWVNPADNAVRIERFGLQDKITSLRSDVRNLKFQNGFFDAIIGIDCFQYFATDDLFLPYIMRYLKPQGTIAFSSAATMQEVKFPIPEHLQKLWGSDCWGLHTNAWWKKHWERTGLLGNFYSDAMDDGWKVWLQWAEICNCDEWYLETLKRDQGNYLGYIRLVGRLTKEAAGLSFDSRDFIEQ